MGRLSPTVVLLALPALAQHPPPDDFFADPQTLCSVLEDAGIRPGPWRALTATMPSPYGCDYPVWNSYPLESIKTTARLEIVFRVSGDTQKRADILSLAVTAHQDAALSDAEKELARLVHLLFTRIGRSEPAGLTSSIERQRYYRSRQAYGTVWFNVITPAHRQHDRVVWFRLWK